MNPFVVGLAPLILASGFHVHSLVAPAAGEFALAEQDTVKTLIEVTPSRKDNDIKLSDRKDVEIAILGGTMLRLETVDAQTLKFAGISASRGLKLADVDYDARDDMVFVVATSLLKGLKPGAQEVCVTGLTDNNTPFKGCARINVLP